MRTRRTLVLGVVAALVGSLTAVGVVPEALAVAPAAAPTLTSPPDATLHLTTNPVLTWTGVPGATTYRVQIAAAPSFASPVYDQTTVELAATPPDDLAAGLWYWRVAGSDSSNNLGPYSSPNTFSKDENGPPTLLLPADNATVHYPNDPPVFSWDAVPGAKSYTLEIDDASDFIGESKYTTANTSFTLAEPQTVGQTFYWRVYWTSTANVASQPSETRQYTEAWLSKPTLHTPANTVLVSVADPNFTWDPVPGAGSYQLQVSPNGDWANNVTINATNLRGTAYSPPITLDNGSYFWRVRAADTASTPNFGAWSDEWQFTRGWVAPDPSSSSERVSLLTPQWSANDPNAIPHVPGSLGLSWSPIHHASRYEIEISTDINFPPVLPPVTEQCITNHTSFTPYDRVPIPEPNCEIGGLSTGVVYYWHVRGIDDPQKTPTGIRGVWSNTGTSDTFRFIVDPTMPQVTGPADGAAVSAPTLTWQAVQGAEKYKVWVFKANNSAVSGSPFTTYATSYTPKALTAADGPFRWYVAAIDANGDISAVPAQQNQRTFTLVDPATSGTLTLTGPVSGSSSLRMPTLSWSAVTGAKTYVVHYGSNGFESGTPLGDDLSFTTFTYPSLPLAPDTYFWYVEAQDGQGATITTSAERTFVISVPDVLGSADYLTPTKCVLPNNCTPIHDTPTLSWNPVPGAGLYEVTIAYDADFTNVLRVYDTAYTTLTPRESLVDNQAGQAFYWFVRPCLDSGLARCGPAAQDDTANNNASAFQKNSLPITLLSAANDNPPAGQITFTWQDFLDTNGGADPPVTQEAKQYQIDVSTVQDFATILDTATVDETTYTPYSKTYPEGPLYWRVQAIDGSGNHLTWSAPGQLVKSSPAVTLGSPAGGATISGLPAFSWNARDYAAKYTIEVYKNADLNFSSANRVLSATAKFTAWAPTTGLATGGYAWRVRAVDPGGSVGPWSTGRLFTLQAAAPGLVSPVNGFTGAQTGLVFAWSAPADNRVVKYNWQLSASNGFGTLQSSRTTVMTAWAPTGTISDGTHYWRVQVLDAGGNVIAVSGVRSVTIDGRAPTVTSRSPLSSASLTGAFEATFSEAVEHVSGSTFKVSVGSTSTTVPGVVTTTSASAKFTPTVPLVPGQSYTAKLTSGITDLAGNRLAPYSWTVRTNTTVENNSPAVHEVWDRDTSAHASGGSYDSSATVGSSARFTFTGTNAAIIGVRSASGGYADVYLDGVKKAANVSFFNAATQWQHTMWSASGLSNAKHSVQVRVLGTHPGAATGSWVRIDAFRVGTSLYQENNSAVTEAFRRVKAGSANGGSYDTASHMKGADNAGRPYYSMTFAGTGVTVYGVKSPGGGSAAVYVDGVLRATVSLDSSTTFYRSLVYNSPALSNKTHTIRVEMVGTSSGKNSAVAVDYFRVG